MERPYSPAPGITRFMAGTPSILVLAAIEEAVRITAEAGIDALRAKSIAQTELIVALHDEWLVPLGFELGSPRDPARRGSHVALNHPEAWPICRALIERADVIPDFRGPNTVRLGVAPLYTRYVDVYDAMARLRDLVERRCPPRGRPDAGPSHLDDGPSLRIPVSGADVGRRRRGGRPARRRPAGGWDRADARRILPPPGVEPAGLRPCRRRMGRDR